MVILPSALRDAQLTSRLTARHAAGTIQLITEGRLKADAVALG